MRKIYFLITSLFIILFSIQFIQPASAQNYLLNNHLPEWLTQFNIIENNYIKESINEMLPRNANNMTGEDYLKAIEHVNKMVDVDDMLNIKDGTDKTLSLTMWEPIGAKRVPVRGYPGINANGRIRCIAWYYNRSTPGREFWESYAGASSGGVWRKDQGFFDSYWYPFGNNMPNPSVGALCVYYDYIRGAVIFAGTGDWARFNGAGLFRSTNNGNSWDKIPLMDGATEVVPTAITGIARKENYGYPDSMFIASDMGFFRSPNGVLNFTRIPIIPSEPSYGIFSMVGHPLSASILYAALPYRGVYKTTNGGNTWFPVNSGLPSMNRTGRTMALAISQSNPQVLYVSVTDTNTDIMGVYRTTNSGTDWTRTNAPTDISVAGQAFHAHTIAVHPTDWRTVYVGSVSFAVTRDGGDTWNWANCGHSDMTGIYFFPNNPNKMLLCNDGGVFIRDDSRNTIENDYENFSGGAPIQQYGMDYAVSEPNMLVAGTQDNGTMISRDAFPGGAKWEIFSGCDGANFVSIDPTNSNYFYFNSWCGASNPRLRSQNRAESYEEINNGLTEIYYTPILMNKFNTNTLFTITNQSIFYSSNRGNEWRRVNSTTNHFTTGQFPRAIAVNNGLGSLPLVYTSFWRPQPRDRNPADPTPENRIVIADGTPGFMSIRNSFLPDNSMIRIIIADNTHPDIAYAVPENPGYRLYKTTDRGRNWVNITGSRPDSSLPPAFTNYVVSKPSDESTLFAGTDVGVFRSTNNGATWQKYQFGLPIVPVLNIVYITSSPKDILKIGTFGRGFWQRSIDGDDPTWGPLPSAVRRENQCPDSLIFCRLYRKLISLRTLDSPVWLIPPGCFMVANDKGTIERTFDAGKTWEMFNLPTKEKISSIAPMSESSAFAVGEEGGMFMTNDFGENWTQIQTQYQVPLLSVSFSSANEGFIIADEGLMLKSNDGGFTWSEFMNDPTKNFQLLYFINSSNGLISGLDNKTKPATPFILRTNDGGKSWDNVTDIPTDKTINKILFTSETEGFILGSGGFLRKTFDGGVKWEDYGSNQAKDDLYDIAFKDQFEGYISGANGLILRTTDGGKAWYQEETQITDNIYQIVADTVDAIAVTDTLLLKRIHLNNREIFGQPLIKWVNPDYDTLDITDVKEVEGLVNDFQIYPNPTNSVLNVKFTNTGAVDAEIKIINIWGKELKSFNEKCSAPGTYLYRYDLNDLVNGIYYIQLKSKYISFMKSVVVIK